MVMCRSQFGLSQKRCDINLAMPFFLKILVVSMLLMGSPLSYSDEKGERVSATYFDIKRHKKTISAFKLRLHGYTNSDQIDHTLECAFAKIPLTRKETVGIFRQWLDWHEVAIETKFSVDRPVKGWESFANFKTRNMEDRDEAFTWLKIKHPKVSEDCDFMWKLQLDSRPIKKLIIESHGYDHSLKYLRSKIAKRKSYLSDDPYK